ncbi:MAG TPA: lipopolysaccharide transport periplasmic protein LptA [Candidatus Kryptonia bacterium]|nr:lipopolysaccharide transport periplasmic protein LptA [Candidatus Kryptonia bacterium]
MWGTPQLRRRLSAVALLALTTVRAGAAFAAAPDAPVPATSGDPGRGLFNNFSLGSSKEPIHVSADMLEFDYKQQVLVYRGGVEVTQGDLSLHSNTLTLHFDEKASERDRLQQIVAEGEVRIGKGERFATGGRAVFDQASKTVTLTEDAVLHDGPNRVAGDRVVVYLDQGRSVVEGGDQRVHAVLVPPSDSATRDKIAEDIGGH